VNEDNNSLIAFYDSQKGGIFARFVRRCTRWAWASQVRAPINRMYEIGMIDSRVFHEAHAYADKVIHATKPPVISPGHPNYRPILSTLAIFAAVALCSCQTFTAPTPAQNSAIAATAGTIAQAALGAVAASYGGPAAGLATSAVLGAVQPQINQATANGLNSVAVYVQGQVGSKASPAIVAASAGTPGVGQAVAPLISPTATISQADADVLFQAAALALKKK
jgi:hypothetical protein